MSQQPERHDRDDEEDLDPGLTDKKIIAVELSCMGKGPEEIAQALKVTRQTIWRWFRQKAVLAARQRMRAELHQQRTERFWHLQSKALDVAEESLDEGDPRMATDILKLGAAGFRDIVEVEGLDAPELPARAPTDDGEDSRADEGSPERDGGEDARTCELCGRVSKSPRGLAQHVRRSHP